MSLPPNFLDELRGRLSLSQVVGRKVTWDLLLDVGCGY